MDMSQKDVSRTLTTPLGSCQHFGGKWAVLTSTYPLVPTKRCWFQMNFSGKALGPGAPSMLSPRIFKSSDDEGLMLLGGNVCVMKKCFAEKSRQIWRSPLPIASLYPKSTLPIAWPYACSSGECPWALCTPFGVWKQGEGMPPTCETSLTCR